MTLRPPNAVPASATALLVLACAACGDASPGPTAEVVDSAGVTLVTSGPEDRPLGLERTVEFRLGGKEDETESFYEVGRSTVAASPEGNIAVLDADGRRVLVYDPQGRHLRTMGREGEGPGELSWPVSVFWTGEGHAMVYDLSKRGLVGYGPEGEPVEAPALPEDFFGGAVVADGDGLVLLERSFDPMESRLLRIDSEGNTRTLVAVPQGEGRMVELESCGMRMSGMLPLFAPTLRWAVRDGTLAVVDGAGYVVDLYVEGERVRSVRRELPPRPATVELAASEVGDAMRVMTSAGERVCDADEVAEQRGFAEVVPAVRQVVVAPDGTLWVQRWTVGDEPTEIDIVDPEGVYRGTLPAGTQLPLGFLPDGRVLWSETDDFDVERLVVARVTFTDVEGADG